MVVAMSKAREPHTMNACITPAEVPVELLLARHRDPRRLDGALEPVGRARGVASDPPGDPDHEQQDRHDRKREDVGLHCADRLVHLTGRGPGQRERHVAGPVVSDQLMCWLRRCDSTRTTDFRSVTLRGPYDGGRTHGSVSVFVPGRPAGVGHRDPGS